MYRRVKADFHAHAADDPSDDVRYSSEWLIDCAAKLNFEVLAITTHGRALRSGRLADYAWRRGVLLVPAAELLVEGRHVVVLNPDEEQASATTFGALREFGRRDAFFIAPHPWYPAAGSLRQKLTGNADLFDAVEYSSVYLDCVNPNRRAVREARRFGLPVVGCSDVHMLPYEGMTFSWIDVEELSVPGVIDALRAGRVEFATRPCPVARVVWMLWFALRDKVRETVALLK